MADANRTLPWDLGPDCEWMRYWALAAPHREKLTGLITASAASGSTACIWGAGGCHDIDLRCLADHFDEVTLVDLDAQRLQWGVEFQFGGRPANVKILAPVDLAGVPVRPRVDGALRGIEPRELAAAVFAHRVSGLGRYDLIVSAGMLSQVALDVVEASGAGQQHERSRRPGHELADALTATRRSHLRLMLDHLGSGGVGLVVVDLINSDDAPEIVAAENLDQAVSDVVQGIHPSHQLAPERLHHDLLMHPSLKKRVAKVEVTNHWLWQMTKRHYACYAVRLTAAGTDS